VGVAKDGGAPGWLVTAAVLGSATLHSEKERREKLTLAWKKNQHVEKKVFSDDMSIFLYSQNSTGLVQKRFI
jgi:hypothetical protein